jgi:hypothetical protein
MPREAAQDPEAGGQTGERFERVDEQGQTGTSDAGRLTHGIVDGT